MHILLSQIRFGRKDINAFSSFYCMNETVTSVMKIVLKHLTHLFLPRYDGTLLWYSLLVVMIGLFCSSCEVLGVWRAWVCRFGMAWVGRWTRMTWRVCLMSGKEWKIHLTDGVNLNKHLVENKELSSLMMKVFV